MKDEIDALAKELGLPAEAVVGLAALGLETHRGKLTVFAKG